MKSTIRLRESREDISRAELRAIASPRITRLLSLVALAALAAGVLVGGRGVYFAITDAWVAPLQLSPDSREIVALRVQASRDQEQQARLQSELTSAAAEIAAINLSLGRLRTLQDSYARGIRWSTSDRGGQLATLVEQKRLLEGQRALTLEPIARYQTAVERARRDLAAGVITTGDLAAVQDNLARTQLTRDEKELEVLRVTAALEETARAAAALAGAAAPARSAGKGEPHTASPDVVRLDELRINTELQIARLGAEQRAAEARQRAATSNLKSMDELKTQLDTTPLFLAARREIDLAFVPYAHLDGVRAGDAVYVCRWFFLGCREAGRIKRIFPGEVVTDDPWGSAARGHYVELAMSDRSVMAERTLRVRRRGPAEMDSVVADRLNP